MVKIDDKTNVPLGWLLSALGIVCGGVWVTATFVGRISDDVRALKGDMHLVKKKLKIDDSSQEEAEFSIAITPVKAAEK